MKWEREHIDLGTVKVHDVKTLRYKATEVSSTLEIKKIETSCGCTSAKFDKQSGFLTANYKAGKIPRQRRADGFYTTSKKIGVHTNEGLFTLTFKAKVTV